MGVYPFLSVALICSNSGEQLTAWMGVHLFLSVALICSSTGEATHSLDGCSPFLVSGSDLLKDWRGDSLAGWVFTRSCQWLQSAQALERRLTCWMGVHLFLSVGLICSTAGERLTAWMVVHTFLLEVNLIKY